MASFPFAELVWITVMRLLTREFEAVIQSTNEQPIVNYGTTIYILGLN